jgi:ABC-type amino acid transport system permease subunit
MAVNTSGKSSALFQLRQRAILYQALLVALICFAAWYFIANTLENLLTRRIA